MTKRKLLYIFLVISVVPGLVVSFLLKENFERPRPRDVTEFNGTKDFYKAFTITHEGKKSFSSGHVAAAFSLLGLVYLVQRRRAFWFALTLTYALSMMVARVASGAHFLSDVVTSFFIVYIANLILYYYLIEKNKKEENL
jgi:lipid A 4'-phosphatase